MAHRPARTADAGQGNPDHALTAGRAHGPPPLALQLDPMLLDEHAPAPARPGADCGTVLLERLDGAGNAETHGVTQ